MNLCYGAKEMEQKLFQIKQKSYKSDESDEKMFAMKAALN